jgi:peptidoglycan biosynthesis protein MviN/MurJ (putative lipid II flippase)
LNFFLIPIYGATGAAIATAICEITVTLIQLVIVITKKYLSAIKILSKSWKYIIAAGVMFVPIYFMQKYMPYAIWSFAVITLTGIVVYFLSLLVLRDQFFISNVKNVVNIMKNKIKKKKVEE